MRLSTKQPNREPAPPPEYANVRTLRWIGVFVGCVCLAIASYATWTIYTLSNRIGMNEIPLEVANLSQRFPQSILEFLNAYTPLTKKKNPLFCYLSNGTRFTDIRLPRLPPQKLLPYRCLRPRLLCLLPAHQIHYDYLRIRTRSSATHLSR